MTGRESSGLTEMLQPVDPDTDLLTVVTVVLNDVQHIRQTLESVISQGYPLQYIVVDGGSTDGTLEVLHEYKDYIDVLVSEPDRGIYHAMNKAIAFAGGVWVCFLNSGDCFYRKDVLLRLGPWLQSSAEVLYGDWEIRWPGRARLAQASDQPGALWQGMPASHQSCLVRRRLLQAGFDERYTIAADFALFYHLHLAGCRFTRVPLVLASVSAGGISDQKRLTSLYQQWIVVNKTWKINFYYAGLILREIIKMPLRKLLGRM